MTVLLQHHHRVQAAPTNAWTQCHKPRLPEKWTQEYKFILFSTRLVQYNPCSLSSRVFVYFVTSIFVPALKYCHDTIIQFNNHLLYLVMPVSQKPLQNRIGTHWYTDHLLFQLSLTLKPFI